MHAIDQLAATQHPPGLLQQRRHHRELEMRELKRPPIGQHLVAVEHQLELTEAQHR